MTDNLPALPPGEGTKYLIQQIAAARHETAVTRQIVEQLADEIVQRAAAAGDQGAANAVRAFAAEREALAKERKALAEDRAAFEEVTAEVSQAWLDAKHPSRGVFWRDLALLAAGAGLCFTVGVFAHLYLGPETCIESVGTWNAADDQGRRWQLCAFEPIQARQSPPETQ